MYSNESGVSTRLEWDVLENRVAQPEPARVPLQPTDLDLHEPGVVGRPNARPIPRTARPRSAEVRIFRDRYHTVKRVMDVSVCLVMLVVALPLMLVCALLIWLEDPGQVLLQQWRTGKSGRRFRMFKFRTMVKNAEELKQKYVHMNEHTWPDFKITNDPRVTRIGKILRKSSLDELPQLFNVLKGEMSLVGPRPTSFEASTYDLWHTERLEVMPGITGLAQVNGRNDVDFDERIRLDVEYIERRSVLFDVQILLRTLSGVFSRRGAY